MAITGCILEGVHYYAEHLPQQNTLKAPENASGSRNPCATCMNNYQVGKDIFFCSVP